MVHFMQKTDVIVVGGGLVGMAIAYGLACRDMTVRVIDEGDEAFRAARGNFGLVWVQGKGVGKPSYAQWTRNSAALWPMLAKDLFAETGVDVQLQQPGGYQLCLSDDEMVEETRRLHWLSNALGNYPFEELSRAELLKRLPGIGPEVVGACYSPMDGHVNPLKLLYALHAGAQRRGVILSAGRHVTDIMHSSTGFELRTSEERWKSEKLVLAAGLGNRILGSKVGLNIPVRPNRGQILVTERLERFLTVPTTYVRQTDEGTVQLGDSLESVGFNDLSTTSVMGELARRAVSCFPRLASVNVVRAWGALRVLSPDGYPIYQHSPVCPGAFAVTCHSGVTLAAVHARVIAPWIAGSTAPPELSEFSHDRFAAVDLEAAYVH